MDMELELEHGEGLFCLCIVTYQILGLDSIRIRKPCVSEDILLMKVILIILNNQP